VTHTTLWRSVLGGLEDEMTRTIAVWTAATVGAATVLAVGSAIAQPLTARDLRETRAAGQVVEVVPLTAEEVLVRVEAAGYRDVDALDFEHGRYELGARDPNKVAVLLIVNPNTGEIRSRLARKRARAGRMVSVDEIVPQVEAAGFKDIYLIEREHALYEIHTRDAEGRGVELYLHPRTGELLRHPKTGALLREEIEKTLPFENILTVEEIVAVVKEAGYPTVYAIGHESRVYKIDAEDEQGRMFSLYLDPDSGRSLRASLRRWLPLPLLAARPD
jgi:predicted lactoylglutathione lyase